MSIIETIHFLEEFQAKAVNSPEFEQIRHLIRDILAFRSSTENKLIAEPNFSIQGINYVSSLNNAIDKSLRSFSPSRAGQRLSAAKLLSETGLGFAVKSLSSSYLKQIETFLDQIEAKKLGGANNANEIYGTSFAIHSAEIAIDNYLGGLKESINIINNTTDIAPENLVQLSFASIDQSLHLHLETTTMILRLYECMAEVLNVSITNEPLILKGHFSASDHYSLEGNPNVVSAVTMLIQDAATFFSENFTKSGEFTKLSRHFDVTVQQLHVLEDLKKRNIDITESTEVLQKNLIFIVDALNDNLRHQYKVTVNRQEFQIFPDPQKAFPYAQKQLPAPSIDTTA